MAKGDAKTKPVKTCPKCGGRITPNAQHVHRDACPVCERPKAFCKCGETKRPKVNGGDWPGLKSIVTICPIEHATEARIIAARFLNNGEPPEMMLDVEVAAGGAKDVTHVMCERHAFPDEVQLQQAFMTLNDLPWISGEIHSLNDGLVDKFCMYVKEDEDTFEMLDVREV